MIKQICSIAFAMLATTANASDFFDENGAYYGPSCDETNYTGAYYTGDYTSPFKTILDKTDEEIQAKLDELWNHYFKGDNNSKVYYDKGNEAYIKDINNNDVRSEGMSYGMMIAVQTGHKEEFDKLWKWAKNHMWHKSGSWDGYFAWQRNESGSGGDDNCAPDSEMYFMMSLMFAANRWNDDSYMEDAQYILKKMWENTNHKLFNPQHYVITFQPQGNENNFSDPSYDLPAFVDLFSRWSTSNQDKWEKAAKATRDHLYKSSNKTSGLFSDYNNFDGTPHSVEYNQNATRYMYDAMRCAMNFGMDYYLFGVDATRQEEMAKRIIDFFERDNYQHARFDWDGSNPGETYTIGEMGANAVACYALMSNANYKDVVKKNLKKAWDAKPMTGQYRYYDGMVHYLAMLHLCGSFKIWKPQPDIKSKSVVASSEYNGAAYNAGDKVYSFEECQLYETTLIKELSANDITVSVAPKTYTGEALTPEVIVTDGEKILVKDTDYEVELPEGGCTDANDYQITIKGKGNYSGEIGRTFTITAASPTTVGEQNADKVSVSTNGTSIVISNAPIGAAYKVTTVGGQSIANGIARSEKEAINITQSGIYIITINDVSFKVAK